MGESEGLSGRDSLGEMEEWWGSEQIERAPLGWFGLRQDHHQVFHYLICAYAL